VYRNQFKANNTYQNFSVSINNPSGSSLEFKADYLDKATISIDNVTVTKRVGKYEAEGSIVGHEQGRASGEGWQATPSLDGTGYMLISPNDANISIGKHMITYRMKIDNNTSNQDVVAVLDVWDPASKSVVKQEKITRKQFASANQYQDFSLSFDHTQNKNLEFRVWYADKATLTVDNVTVN
jgi:hypothetical protein